MKPSVVLVARYRKDGAIHHGRIEDDVLVRLAEPPWQSLVEAGPRDARDRTELLAPVAPGKIVCVGLNYRAHVAESVTTVASTADGVPTEPLLFLKPPSAVIGPEDAIRYPAGVTRMDPEAEMGVVIGRRARKVNAPDALDHVAGLVCVNDVSARNYQRQDGQWTRAKGFDTFAPLGPWLAMGLDPRGLGVECRVNGAVRQSGNTRDLLFPVTFLIEFISHIMTLEPGDVIATGTPAGVAPIEVGDRVEVEVEGVGVLVNRVEAAD
jgi:2-keto-4-pentenoate hydratase/2-oxohepta-3-ene-1,7-dioic acid hydratase in catechol pathway